jgi:hypothetical protein
MTFRRKVILLYLDKLRVIFHAISRIDAVANCRHGAVAIVL